MRSGPLVLLLVCVVAVLVIAPGLKVDQPGPVIAPSSAPGAMPMQDAAMRQAWLAGRATIARSADGHFYIDATVEGEPVHFLVDTGASIVALTGEDAQAAGLHWNPGEVMAIGRGANGTVYGVPVHLSKIAIDGFEAHDVDAAIVPEGLDVSLLGQSFLAKLRTVEITGDQLSLGE
ncbi:TIGR02281 family clan AA aspartic protease [Novosphingobium sp. 1949]|uniref:TIGR02281 family clan AA aspartic protease n=1 Tax=Novosphingobium organovorum TaxID=2930092 RepID=A0ABT0B9L0_9SPHN|nr:TIGR02281 family clan AA aspartic protease [Novosphingobium organovorum]MCJ2181548.1 TIGR02281 family clan AA aspartic protease [Novosphingobium organovorum]